MEISYLTIILINVKNFHGSLTTVVRLRMTPLKQQISLIPFSIEHWYSPYKRRRFENRSDQTFCILLARCSVCNRECKPPSTPKFETKVIWIRIQIFGLIWIRMSVEYPFQNCGYIRRRHSFCQVWFKSAVDCMRTEKTEKC